ncbi:hypothetical protein A33M_1153 [Rhodovulum sp. PH10]|uniref:FitA-like ribbon-helix-helix domain-containing protein n=1 Tax=Rhodovulum sp. PH10 TaxID=1187851 RepID=UPI00027C20EA|nr:hypothetical protein [Rhodovulum sp. PH10]EJW09594.1 hypothetical protein A33M_1153 [Rhodovulum sp. PH10]
MAILTIHELDDDLAQRLRLQAARNGRSMEEEARHILAETLPGQPAAEPDVAALNVAEAIAAIVDPIGGIDIEISERTESVREPPRFDDWPDDP